jgi:C4-dicarboxylate-specific signal transduction histidine kinase
MSDATVRRIHVSLESDGSSVILRVHDNGPGFDEVMRHQLGQPFVTTKLEGLGVGLSISKTIADMHSGNLSISNAVDGGAVVELNLPAVTS